MLTYEEDRRPNIDDIINNPIFNNIRGNNNGFEKSFADDSTQGDAAEILNQSRRDFTAI